MSVIFILTKCLNVYDYHSDFFLLFKRRLRNAIVNGCTTQKTLGNDQEPRESYDFTAPL